MSQIIGRYQLHGDAARGRALKDRGINLHGALVFLGSAVKILLREIGGAQIAVEAGVLLGQFDGLLVFPYRRAKLAGVVIECAKIVVGFGIILVSLDGLLKFLARLGI